MREYKARGALSGRIYIALFTIFLFGSFNVFIVRKGISSANGPHQIKKGYKTSPTADAAQQITSAKESKAQESSVSEEADVAPTGDGDDATAADTSSSSANANTSNTKPTFFIHFGPKKTGSSTIQYGFTSSYKLLQSSTSYRYVGRTGGGPNDFFPSDIYDAEITETRKGIKELSTTLLLHLREGNSPFYSSERLSTLLYNADDKKERFRFENLESLIDSVRQDGFRVKPVVVYRRLFSWVPSYHAQRVFRHKNPECRVSMIRWFDLHDEIWECNNSGTFIDQHPTQKLVDRLNSHLKLDDIAIVNLHRMTPDDEGDIFRQVVREVLPGSKLFLKKFGQEYSLEPSNTSSSKITDFHHLATAVALTDGFSHDNAKKAAQKMSKNYDKIVKMFGGEDNIPTLCFSDDQLTKLLEMSLKFEKELLPEWFAMDGTEIDHRNAFQEHVDGGKFCEWDVEKMLQKKELQDFVKNSF